MQSDGSRLFWASEWRRNEILHLISTFKFSLQPNFAPSLLRWNKIFHNLKNSHQDLFNKGSNFILSSLGVGHWVAQTQPFFDKLPEITDFGLLLGWSNFDQPWPLTTITRFKRAPSCCPSQNKDICPSMIFMAKTTQMKESVPSISLISISPWIHLIIQIMFQVCR